MTGLRERKKQRTRVEIQRHALRLFRSDGYDNTTMEQIAEAAGVPPSTVFRYFPTKEDLIGPDDFAERLAEAFDAQPASLGAVAALRGALREVLAEVSASDLEARLERQIFVLSVPRLWTAHLPGIAETSRLLCGLVARRTGRPDTDVTVRATAGAVLGVLLSVWLEWAEDPAMDPVSMLDERLAVL